jgi:hypothetical protein
MISAVGEPALIITWEVFSLEAKAIWGHTCIAGGLLLLLYNKNETTEAVSNYHLFFFAIDIDDAIAYTRTIPITANSA